MVSFTLSRPLVWGIVIFLGLAILLPAQDLPAQDVGCFAVDRYDLPRDCTFLEEHGHCLVTALESYDQCVEDSDGFWDRAGCEVGVQVDLLACNLSAPFTLIDSIIN